MAASPRGPITLSRRASEARHHPMWTPHLSDVHPQRRKASANIISLRAHVPPDVQDAAVQPCGSRARSSGRCTRAVTAAAACARGSSAFAARRMTMPANDQYQSAIEYRFTKNKAVASAIVPMANEISIARASGLA